MTAAGVRRIRPEDRKVDDPTPGQTRERAVSTEGIWSGIVRADGGEVSGWHHHGDHTTVAFVLSGVKRLEFGPGGREVVEGHPGDFLVIAPGAVHRESNPSEEESETVAFRTGSGPPTINVEGPQER
jgi:uncharacterized RmlC-like cupin family protein